LKETAFWPEDVRGTVAEAMKDVSVRAGQTFHERLPAPGAGSHVSCTWIQRIAAGVPSYLHRTVPNGCVELTYELGAEHVAVIGPRRGPVVESLVPGATVVGVRFHPGAAPDALGVPAFELSGRTVELTSIWGKRASILAERLAEADSPTQVTELIEREVTARLAGCHGRDPVAAATLDALRREPSIDMRRIAADLFVSDRQLRRRCQTAFGYSAKTMQRVLRFQRFLALNSWDPREIEDGISRLACAAGYADQPHLTRECVALTGLPPTRFLVETRRSCGPSHDHKTKFAPFLPAPTETE
jgi:AraC-like DNA-binding protein